MPKGLYSPKIAEDLIPVLYRIAKAKRKPMTQVVSEILKDALAQEIELQQANEHKSVSYVPESVKTRQNAIYEDTEVFKKSIKGLKIKLDCGHYCTIGHNFANTLIIISGGKGIIKTYCHNCY